MFEEGTEARRHGGTKGLCAAAGLVALGTVFASCGTPPGVLFPPPPRAMVWPPPPDRPRIGYVGELSTTDDLRAGRSFGQGLGETLFGAPAAQSMLSPYALCADDAGERLFVCDTNAQIVHVFDLERRLYEQWRPDAVGRTFSQPVGIAMDGEGRLLVSDSVAATVFVFDSDGTCQGSIGAGLFTRPCGLAVDRPSGRVFVADSAAHEVLVLSADGRLLERLGGRGLELGRFNFPTNVAVDQAGRLYVADTLNFRVQQFDADLTPLRQFGSKGDLPGYFSQPKGLAVDDDGHLYVVDAHFESVQIFDDEGRLLLTFGREGSGPGEFWLPAGIHIDANSRVWVADPYNRRVQVFEYFRELMP